MRTVLHTKDTPINAPPVDNRRHYGIESPAASLSMEPQPIDHVLFGGYRAAVLERLNIVHLGCTGYEVKVASEPHSRIA